MKKIKVGSDFSGVGAFDQALIRLGIDYETVFACDMDKYARKTFIANYGEPVYYPENVYNREIPNDSLSIYMTSPPCQAFSLAGKRKGKEDLRGILFFNSHEFIIKNKPRFFIFENVKGLLSDDNGNTFQEWLNYLGGKSVNGVPILFPTDEAAPYHIYWKVINAKNHNIPQNRERVFIIGIRDDEDNVFDWPREQHLNKRLKDVLENEVDEKYFLSDKMVSYLVSNSEEQKEKGNGFKFSTVENSDTAKSITAKPGQRMQDNFLKIKSATKSGFEIGTENDSINFSVPNSETRRGRVGVGVAQTLDTGCNQAVIIGYTRDNKGKVTKRHEKEISGTITTSSGGGGSTDQFLKIGTWRTHKDGNGFREIQDGNCPTIPARAREDGSGQPVINDGYRIRRLTPIECFRLMDFPDLLVEKARKVGLSDSQLYKQAGNSICVGVLAGIINGLKKLK
jgi:DNA (cytosine-5)-methyltransferase 1